MIYFCLLLLFSRVSTQEVTTPSSQLKPRNFNHHSFNAEKFLKDLNMVEPTKKGPVLFPNDSPPPPRPPLIVTSRPLVESIARSELSENNTETSQSQINKVSFAPFLARVKDYRPYVPSPTFDYHFGPTRVPYADVVKKTRLNTLERDNRYNYYEEQTVLPPIYKALSDHANQNVLKSHQQQNLYQTQPESQHYQDNDINDEKSLEYDQNQNYAFSYTVKDHKTGDDFSHSQKSSGSATNGEYRVRLPDGRMQIVSYTADENGYKADVRYDDDDDKKAGNTIEEGYNQHNDYVRHNEHNDYAAHNEHNDYEPPNKQNDHNKYSYVTTPRNYVRNSQQSDYSDRYNDYTDRNVKLDYADAITNKKDQYVTEKQEKDYYQYPDVSKEYYNDYSSEYNSNVEPHRSKFSFVDNKNVEITNKASTVQPSYDELKDLFVTKSLYNARQNYDEQFRLPSTTAVPYDGKTERIVFIGNKLPKLYTNIKHSLPINGDSPISYPSPKVIVATTPRSYLVSTIASLKNNVHLVTKPVLSESFINRINKYISFK